MEIYLTHDQSTRRITDIRADSEAAFALLSLLA